MIALQVCLLTNMSRASTFQPSSSVDLETPRTKKTVQKCFPSSGKYIFFNRENMSYYSVKISNDYCQLLFGTCLINDKYLLI